MPGEKACTPSPSSAAACSAVYRGAIVGNDQSDAAHNELTGNSETDAPRTAGDQGDAAVEPVRIRCLIHPVISNRAFSAAV
jgi:hypothetical protein